MTSGVDGAGARDGGRRLKVGLVCPYSFDAPGGVQNHVLGLARHLRDRGHDPHILAPGQLDHEWFTSAGAPVPVRYNGSTARVNFGPLSAVRVRRWLSRGQFDLLHVHEPITPSVSVLAVWAADVPVVATFHTATPRSRSMQLAGAVMQATVAKIGAGIAVSESARTVVVQHLGRDAVVIPNGFTYDEFARVRPGAPGGRPPGEPPRLSFLGRLDEPRKGLDTLLAALPLIRADFGDVDVVVAGLGHRRLPAGCHAVGVISDRQKAELLVSSDVFVAPHVARESFGIVLLEAMASGTAVVASDLDAFSDILTGSRARRHQILGTTFAAGDPRALAHAVAGTLRRPDDDQIAAAARASRRYDWSVVGADICEVYRATVNPLAAGFAVVPPTSIQPRNGPLPVADDETRVAVRTAESKAAVVSSTN